MTVHQARHPAYSFRSRSKSIPRLWPLAMLGVAGLLVLGDAPAAQSARDSKVRKFAAEDKVGKNQLLFHLDTGTEKVTGLSNDPRWSMSFDPAEIVQSLSGTLVVAVTSLDAGKREHNEKLRGPGWLDSTKYPEIRFELRAVKQAKKLSEHEWQLQCAGTSTVRGTRHDVETSFRLVYRAESETTRARAPGDLVSLSGKFELPQNIFGEAGDPDRTIALELRLFGSTAKSSGKPGAPGKSAEANGETAIP